MTASSSPIPARRFSWKRLLPRVAFTGLFVWVLWRFLQGVDVGAQVRQFDPVFAAASLLLSVVMVGLSTLKWRILLGQQGHRLSYGYLVRVYLIGYYFSNVLPSSFGGDVARSWYTGQRIGSQSRAAVAVFLERFTGLIVMLLLALLAPCWLPGAWGHSAFWLPALLAAGMLTVIGWLAWHPAPLRLPDTLARGIIRLLGRLHLPGVSGLDRIYGKVHAALEGFRCKLKEAMSAIGRERRLWIPVWLISGCFYVLTFLNVWLGFRVFGFEAEFLLVAAVVPTALLVATLPISPPGAVGYAETVWVVYFSLLPMTGLAKAAVLLMALVLRFKMLLLGLIGMPLQWTHAETGPVPEETAL